jgi:hypothetical protein
MRYSRFKKQMDGTATVRRPRGPNSPRKKVEKNVNKSPRKGKGKAREEEDERIVKPEPEMGSREGTVESEAVSEGLRMEKKVKLEPGLVAASSSASEPTPRTMPGTPSSTSRYIREVSTSPSPGPSDHERFEGAGMSQMDEMGFSFGMHGNEGLPGMYGSAPSMGEGMGSGFGIGGMGMGLGMQMGMGDPYEGLWHGHHGLGGNTDNGIPAGERGVHVKTEPRWEDAYRHL